MTAEEIDVFLVELNKIGRENAKQKRQNQAKSHSRRGR
jgi:hypothetical protein